MNDKLLIRKRKYDNNIDMCIICQDKKLDILEFKSEYLIRVLLDRVFRRKKVKDVKYYEVIDRIE